MSLKLKQIRKEITEIDNHILQLLNSRFKLSKAALKEKALESNNEKVSVFDPMREQRLIDSIIQNNNTLLHSDVINRIFSTIITESRNFQYKLKKNNQPFTVFIQGAKGSFSEQALKQYCKNKCIDNYQINYSITSNSVLKSVNNASHEYGLVALNNAQGGLVEETINAFSNHRYLIVDSIILLVEQSLITKKDHSNTEIKSIYSHSQALRQCKEYLKTHYSNTKLHQYADTALAVHDLSLNNLPDNSAVIAHKDCIKNTDLMVKKENIHDLTHNETVFLLIKGQ